MSTLTFQIPVSLENKGPKLLGFQATVDRLEESDAFIDFRQGDADGDPAVIERDGWRWEVRMTDVEGLVDLYTAPQMSWPFCRGWTTRIWWQRGCAC